MPMRLKSDLYPCEQGQVRRKILDIIALNTDNTITLYELDNDPEKQKAIMDLIPEILKWFAVRDSDSARYPEKFDRPWLSLIRFILKPKYNIISKDHRIKIGSETVRTQKYFFEKKPRSDLTK